MIIKLIFMAISLSFITASALSIYIAFLQFKNNQNWKKLKKWVFLSYSFPIVCYIVLSLMLTIIN